MRNGSLETKDVEIILSRCIDKLSKDERESFKDAIHLVPQWKMAHPIVFKYLNNMKTPLAKIAAQLQSSRQDSINHCVKESSLPIRLALCVGAKVLLLSNFVVEYKIMNGSIGTVVDIVYEKKSGPRDEKALPAYVTVYFPKSCIPHRDRLFSDKDGRYVSIPVVTEQCERSCCSITMIPLRVCVSITIHKSQGMTIGENEIFTKVVLYLPDSDSRIRTPGSELVGMSIKTLAVLKLVMSQRICLYKIFKK